MNLIRFFVFTIIFANSCLVFALKSDAEEPVTIDSNTASYDGAKEISTYIGNVITIQGSLRIESDKLVIHFNQGEIEKMVFTGKPVIFRQRPAEGKEEIHGEALTAEYYPNLNKLVLTEEAVVSQGNNRSESRLIVYDSKNSVIKAGEQSSDSKRVHSVFKPKTKGKND